MRLPGEVEKVMSPIFSKHDVAIHESGRAVCSRYCDRIDEKIAISLLK